MKQKSIHFRNNTVSDIDLSTIWIRQLLSKYNLDRC